MTNKQRVLIASMLLQRAAQEDLDPLEKDALEAAAYELVGEEHKSADICPTVKQLQGQLGIEPAEGLQDHFGNEDPYSIQRNHWERVNNRFKNAQNSAQAGRL